MMIEIKQFVSRDLDWGLDNCYYYTTINSSQQKHMLLLQKYQLAPTSSSLIQQLPLALYCSSRELSPLIKIDPGETANNKQSYVQLRRNNFFVGSSFPNFMLIFFLQRLANVVNFFMLLTCCCVPCLLDLMWIVDVCCHRQEQCPM